MKRSLLLLAGVVLAFAQSAAQADDQAKKPSDTPDAKQKTRPLPPHKPADGDAKLPEGWPGGTEPGKIEIKSYPAYRSAVAQAKNTSQAADGVLFFSLFNHISRKGVEMTAPVVNTYSDPKMVDSSKAMGDMTMEFLYPSTKVGEAGKGVGAVKVVDHPAQTFVCLGIQGDMEAKVMQESHEKLKAWLEAHKSEWVEDGLPRRLGYHGPMTPRNQRLWELQLPVKAVSPK